MGRLTRRFHQGTDMNVLENRRSAAPAVVRLMSYKFDKAQVEGSKLDAQASPMLWVGTEAFGDIPETVGWERPNWETDAKKRDIVFGSIRRVENCLGTLFFDVDECLEAVLDSRIWVNVQ